MNEEINKNTITYDDGWQEVSSAEYPTLSSSDEDTEENEETEVAERKKDKINSRGQLLVTLQLFACILIAIAALILKTFGGEVYNTVSEWYNTELNKSVIAVSNGENFSLDEFLEIATDDEA